LRTLAPWQVEVSRRRARITMGRSNLPDRQLAPLAADAAASRLPLSAEIELHIGRRGRFAGRVEVTPAGLLAIGGLVSAILLSTSVLVRTAKAGPAAGER